MYGKVHGKVRQNWKKKIYARLILILIAKLIFRNSIVRVYINIWVVHLNSLPDEDIAPN